MAEPAYVPPSRWVPCSSEGRRAGRAHLVTRARIRRRPTPQQPNRIVAMKAICGAYVDYAESARDLCAKCVAFAKAWTRKRYGGKDRFGKTKNVAVDDFPAVADPPRCACGCNQPVKRSRYWGGPQYDPTGRVVAKARRPGAWNRYVNGHNLNRKELS